MIQTLAPGAPPTTLALPEGTKFLVSDLMEDQPSGQGFLTLGSDVSVTLVGLGSGAALDLQQLGRFFYIGSSSNLTLTNLQLSNGRAVVGGTVYAFSGLGTGSSINICLEHCSVVNSSAYSLDVGPLDLERAVLLRVAILLAAPLAHLRRGRSGPDYCSLPQQLLRT